MATALQRQGRAAAQRRGHVARDLEDEGIVVATSLLAAGAPPKECRRAALKAVRARPDHALSWASLAAANLSSGPNKDAIAAAHFASRRARAILDRTAPDQEAETLVQKVEHRQHGELQLWCTLAAAEADLSASFEAGSARTKDELERTVGVVERRGWGGALCTMAK
jgi:hypothetical protein